MGESMTEEELKVAFQTLQAQIEDDQSNLNQFFLLVMGALVMFMQCGFAFLEAGAVRSKNVVNILIKNALDCFCGALSYWAVGFAFAYGTLDDPNPQKLSLPNGEVNINKFIGSKYFFSIYADQLDGGDGYFASWFFQFVFAATAATIVSGAVAERTQFLSYMIYSSIITGFVYPVVSHWGWGGGWLAACELPNFRRMAFNPPEAPVETVYTDETVGYMDFAGSGIVHCTGGIAALMGAIFIGPRIGKFSTDKTKMFTIPGHSVPIASLGGFILFLGFLAFNGGSELAIVGGGGHGQAVALSFMNTVIGGSAGAMFSIVLNYSAAVVQRETPYWSLLTCINGGLAGMVGLCAGCNNLNPGGAFGIGALSGITLWWLSLVVKKSGVDDPLDAFAVHYGGGICGVLLTPIFAQTGIVAHINCEDQLSSYINLRSAAGLDPIDTSGFICDHFEYKVWVWNLIGLIAITLWAGGICALMFYILSLCGVLRIDRDIEIRGLDIKKHGEPAYPTAAYGHGWEKEGDLEMSNVGQLGAAGGDVGKRNTNALANPFENKGWDDTVANDGLIAMALGYKNSHYKGENPAFEEEEEE